MFIKELRVPRLLPDLARVSKWRKSILKSVHFKKTVARILFLSKLWYFLSKTKRNENRATVFLKWTDFSFRNQIKFLHRKLFLLKIDFDVLEILIFRLRQPCWHAQPHKSVIVVVLSFSSRSTFLWHQCWAKPKYVL